MIVSHRLARTSFDAICSATPDLAGLAGLDAAQRTKHLLLLRLVVDRLPERLRRSGSAVSDTLAVLAEIQRHRPAAFNDVISYPYVGMGLVGCLRANRLHRFDHVEGWLAGLVAAAATVGGWEAELGPAPVTDVLHLPGLGALQLAPGRGSVRLACRDGRLIVDGVDVVRESGQDHAVWATVRRLDDRHGPHAPALDDIDPYRTIGGLPCAQRLTAAAYAGWRDVFERTTGHLADVHPGWCTQVDQVLRVLTPLQATRPGQGSSASAWQAYGAVAVTYPRDAIGFAATLVHETQHSVLNALGDLVILYEDDGEHRYYTPWRTDPRPLRGLLHGCYAFLGVADFWARERALGSSGRRADFEFARASLQVRYALDALGQSAALTPDGRHMVGLMDERARRLESPAPDPIEQLARLSGDEHRLTWRLCTVQPDPMVISRAAVAWRAGQPVPLLPDSSVLAPAKEEFVQSDRLRRLAQLALREDWTAGDTVDAEALLAAGDYRSAARQFVVSVRERPDDVTAWSGLAVAGSRLDGPGAEAWRRRPEVVRAVYRGVLDGGGQPPDPLTLAAWLAAGMAW